MGTSSTPRSYSALHVWSVQVDSHSWVGLVVSVHSGMSAQDKIALSLFFGNRRFTSFFISLPQLKQISVPIYSSL